MGAKVVHHARYVIFQIAEVVLSTNLFAAISGPHPSLGAPSTSWTVSICEMMFDRIVQC